MPQSLFPNQKAVLYCNFSSERCIPNLGEVINFLRLHGTGQLRDVADHTQFRDTVSPQ